MLALDLRVGSPAKAAILTEEAGKQGAKAVLSRLYLWPDVSVPQPLVADNRRAVL